MYEIVAQSRPYFTCATAVHDCHSTVGHSSVLNLLTLYCNFHADDVADRCRNKLKSENLVFLNCHLYTSLFTKQVAKIRKQTSTVILKNKENLTIRELN